MRKYLAAAAAGALGAGLAMPAAADEMEHAHMSISGSMVQDIGFGSYVGGAKSMDDIHFQSDSEIKFQGSGMTDGGLKVTATIEMDSDSSGSIDESNLAIEGGFGKIIFGIEDGAANMVGNKGIGNGYAGTGYYDGGENYTPANSGPAPIPNSDDLGIRYITPALGGFQAGISYQVGDGGSSPKDTGATKADNDHNTIAAGMSFSGDFAGTSLTLGANWTSIDHGSGAGGMGKPMLGDTNAAPAVTGRMTEGVDKQQSFGIGASVGIGATSLNIRYDAKGDQHYNSVTGKPEDRKDFGIGVDHSIGALTFGIGYGARTDENMASSYSAYGDPSSVAGAMPKAVDTKTTVISAGAKYNLGGGVEVHAAVTSGDIENAAGMTKCYNEEGADVGMAADGTCESGGHMQKRPMDMDDVGVGLRIALSF